MTQPIFPNDRRERIFQLHYLFLSKFKEKSSMLLVVHLYLGFNHVPIAVTILGLFLQIYYRDNVSDELSTLAHKLHEFQRSIDLQPGLMLLLLKLLDATGLFIPVVASHTRLPCGTLFGLLPSDSVRSIKAKCNVNRHVEKVGWIYLYTKHH